MKEAVALFIQYEDSLCDCKCDIILFFSLEARNLTARRNNWDIKRDLFCDFSFLRESCSFKERPVGQMLHQMDFVKILFLCSKERQCAFIIC